MIFKRLLLVMSTLFVLNVDAIKWTLLVYIQSDDELNAAVCKNLYDLAQAKTDENVHILVQVQMFGNMGLRCVVEGGKIKPVERVALTLDPCKDLKNSMQWAYSNNPAEEYALILGGHGYGILDPVWNAEAHDFRPEIETDYQEMCIIKNKKNNYLHRGILSNPEAKTCLKNADMIAALDDVVNNTLNGKRIAIMGMDACKMAMAEIAYQLAPYVVKIMGSQECELVDGYDYTACVDALMQQLDESAVVQRMVESYRDYYQDKASQYTQSAISTDAVIGLADTMNTIIQYLLDNDELYADMLAVVREDRVQFCEQPSYVDIYDWYDALDKAIGEKDAVLSVLLSQGKDSVTQAIIANIAGPRVPHAHGISIYYPKKYTPSNYDACIFAQHTKWTALLKRFAV